MSTTEAHSAHDEARTEHLFLTRGLIAIGWAVGFRRWPTRRGVPSRSAQASFLVL
jgi:hypothetical protein